jgi:serine-type D-Ala-D-Ala carboxypeptidase/endopeptidase (penicillin-binding protein 4)
MKACTRFASAAWSAAALLLLAATPAAAEARLADVRPPLLAPAPLQLQASTQSSRAKRRSGKATRGRSRRRAARPLAVPAAAPALRHTAPRSAEALASDLTFMLGSSTRSGEWGAMVVSLTRRDTLFMYQPGQQLLPASTMKLMTTAVALDRFGPEHQFSTDVLRDGMLDAHGTLQGNIVLRGDGDPALSNRFLKGDPNAPMETLARFVAGQGVRRITGDVIGDESAFEPKRIPDGWLARYLQSAYAAPVSSLSLNENVVWVAAYPGAGRGPARVVLEPSTSVLPLKSTVRTVPGSAGGSVSVIRTREGQIVARGWIGSRSIPRKYSLVVDDPAPFTAGAFRNALVAQGIQVDGTVRLAPTPTSAVKLTALPSPTLDRLVSVMNRESINHYAELLFRNAARGADHSALGSAVNGEALLQRFLTERVGVEPGTVIAADGSGLSTLDRVTARAMTQLLGYAHQAPWSSAFHASLPVAGESELLKNRMKYTPAHGNLHAKTGTTNEVISLAGYVTAQDGEVLAFTFIYNGTDRWNARSAIDAMGATLAGFERP